MRCRRWHSKLAIGGGEWLFSLMIVTNWPLPHRVLIPIGFAVVLLGWALSLLQMVWQIRALPPETSVAALPLFTRKGVRKPHGFDYRHVACHDAPASEPLTIYIWTPLGSGSVAGRRPGLTAGSPPSIIAAKSQPDILRWRWATNSTSAFIRLRI